MFSQSIITANKLQDTVKQRFYLTNLLNPQIIDDVDVLRKFISHKRFSYLCKMRGDKYGVDAIYLKALNISDYNISYALLISTLSVIDHKKISIKFPIIKSITLPLSFESDSTFIKRLNNLPKNIYSDTPVNKYGDVDKLQHFFGSAYLAFNLQSENLSIMIGKTLELVEDILIVDGRDDERDMRANIDGVNFGMDLIELKPSLPSEYLLY